tara:strand:- start:521 stop:772 length:252 start_codon:yes stop_codon:yes gene_type:complete
MNPSEKSKSTEQDIENEVNKIEDNLNIADNENKKNLEETHYIFGWGQYSEITNGRFAMVGFFAIILIEIISKKSFLDWAGILH